MATKKNKDKKESKQPKFLIFTGLAIQMGVLIYLGATLGKYLDGEYTDDKNWFTILLTLLAIVVSFYFLIKKVNQINEEEEEQ